MYEKPILPLPVEEIAWTVEKILLVGSIFQRGRRRDPIFEYPTYI